MSLRLHTWLCQDAELPCCCRVAWCVARRNPLMQKALCELGFLVFSGSKKKNWKKRKAGGKEAFLADPKVKCNFFFTKTPSVWLSYCSKHRKIGIFAVNNSEVTQFNAWMKQNLGSMFTQGRAISHEISLVICSFITLNPQTLMCKGKIASDFWDGPTTSNLLLWPSKQRTCTGILGKRAKFFPMQRSIQHLSKTQLTTFPGPPDLTEGEGAGKDKMGKPKTCISVAARGILSTLVTAKGTLHPSKAISSRANHTPAGGTHCAVSH